MFTLERNARANAHSPCPLAGPPAVPYGRALHMSERASRTEASEAAHAPSQASTKAWPSLASASSLAATTASGASDQVCAGPSSLARFVQVLAF